MATNRWKTVVIGLIEIVLKPSTLIAMAGPVILSVNRNHLAAAVRALPSRPGPYDWLSPLVENREVYALIEYNVQIYTLMLAWVLLQFEAASWLTCTLHLASNEKRSVREAEPTDERRLYDYMSGSQLTLLLVLLLQFVGVFIYLLLSGALATPEIVALYRPIKLPVSLHPPPVESLISWARVGVVALGIWLAAQARRDQS